MSDAVIHPIVMPKWGLSMTEGKVVEWSANVGDTVTKNQVIGEIETSKITNEFETTRSGVVRRVLVEIDVDVPVGALLAVLSDADTPEETIEAFVVDFQENFVPPDPDGDDGASAMASIEIDGKKINYIKANEESDNIPVLFIHGLGGDVNNWVMNTDVLAEDRPVYAIDLPGHGASSKMMGDGKLDSIVETIGHFTNSVGLSQAHLVGHSLGGGIAILLAARYPALVASLTCIAPIGLGPKINPEFVSQYPEAERRRPVKKVLEMLVSDPALVNKEMIEGFQRYKRLEGSVEAMKSLIADSMPEGEQKYDLRPVLFGLSCPSLVIWGGQDQIIDVSAADNLPEGIRVEVIDAAGHLPHLEKAEEVNPLIANHIAQLR